MPLIKYAQYLAFADGTPAANYPAPVRLLGGSELVPLFTDKAGTVPLANPAMSDGDGLVQFYAAPGAFGTDISGWMFHYAVDAAETDPAWPGTFIFEQSTPATVWAVTHHFGVRPSVTVLAGAAELEAEVSHVDDENLTITFGAPTAGVAYLRR